MADVNTSANMLLPVPIVGVEPGPQWASDINTCLGIIDQHTHAAGSGVQITPAAIDINADLPMGANNLTNSRSLRLSPQNAPLALSADIGCLYESGVDLYYNDADGNQIQITANGAVAGTPGSIANLVSPASASYVAVSSTFVWQSAANTPANLDCASLILRNLVASSKGLTLAPPAAMASNFTITLPSLPASQKIMTLDSSGNVAAAYDVDNTTLQVSGNNIGIIPFSITQGLLAPRPTGSTVAAGGVASSASSGAYNASANTPTDVTNLSVTITTTGRPVQLMCISDGNGSTASAVYGLNNDVSIYFYRGATQLSNQQTEAQGATPGVGLFMPPSAFQHVDFPAAGTYTYTVKAASGSSNPYAVYYAKLVAYEL